MSKVIASASGLISDSAAYASTSGLVADSGYSGEWNYGSGSALASDSALVATSGSWNAASASVLTTSASALAVDSAQYVPPAT